MPAPESPKMTTEKKGHTKLCLWGSIAFGLVVVVGATAGTVIGVKTSKSSSGLRPTPSSPTISEPASSNSRLSVPSISPSPSMTMTPTIGTDGCRTKRIQITHMCNVPDLDDCGSRDTTMDLKVLIQDEQYWPSNTRQDCDYGSYSGACEIPDDLLLGKCYELKNHAEKVYYRDPKDLKITIYDEDFFSDDFIDMYLPDGWYDAGECGEQSLTVTADTKDATYVQMVITSEETIPTDAPSMSPTQIPTVPPTPLPTVAATAPPTPSPTTECGFALDRVPDGLLEMSTELGTVQQVLASYRDVDGANNDGRRLLFGALVRGVASFTTNVIKTVKATNGRDRFATLADVTTIGSSLFSVLGFGDESDPRQEELFGQVFERFDAIDVKLDEIQDEMAKGFQELGVIITSGFAKSELDDWILDELGTLNEDYRAYLNPDHTFDTRGVYEDTFRNSCLNDHSPFATFKALYSHTCKECNKLDGQSNEYILDSFISLAINDNRFEGNVKAGVQWFRGSFGTVIIGAMVQAVYLHSVCLYQPDNVCQNTDPVWKSRLEAMGDALEEVANSLSLAEERIKCRTKKVRITHICNLPDLDPAIIRDDDMDIKLEIDDNIYWPRNIGQDCVDGLGAFNSACVIPDGKLMNGCYALANSRDAVYTSSKSLKLTIRDEDIGWDDTINFFLSGNEWYDSMECDAVQIERTDASSGATIKLRIEAEILHEQWGP